MNLQYCADIDSLRRFLSEYKPKYIVLEGYNAVGKGRLIEQITEVFNYRVYRPDYSGWIRKLPREYRWCIFSSFMEIVSSTNTSSATPILFDRGIFSGIVYNKDYQLAEYYPSIVKDSRVLHILVTCSREDYDKFLKVRNSSKELSYEDYLDYTKRYRKAFQLAGADYIEYVNTFDEGLHYEDTCAGCSHYTSYNNKCGNPIAIQNGIRNVSPNRKRCKYSVEREVQDGKL